MDVRNSPPFPRFALEHTAIHRFAAMADEYLFELKESCADALAPPPQPADVPIQPPSDMIIDSEEHNVVENPLESESALIVSPDQTGSDTDLPDLIRADDIDAMRELALTPLLEQPETIDDVADTWHVEGWRSLGKKEHGPVFQAGGYPWRILLFPFGNNSDSASFYLEHGFPDKPPDDWYCCVQFAIVMWNKNDPALYHQNMAYHRFTKDEGDWGFTKFFDLSKLFHGDWNEDGRPMVEDEAVNITAYVRVVKDETGVLWHNFANYDSKKETGYVGLKNQGATCYLNSLIQSLYFTNAFRKAIYQIPTQDEETLSNSAYTLQRLFYQLQTSNSAVGTNELTKSFGWETRHIFEQQDVQELSRKLMERMEDKMKGTEIENVLQKLFGGKVETYISCLNVKYESRRVEEFWDVSLNVKGNKGIEDSFKDYISVEIMNGENQYYAGEDYKLQDARKGVIFESFPEVLHLQLKRFQYDVERDAMMKINDRYEFPEIFDAGPYLSDKADRSEPWIYQLHGVLVHSGDLNAGHYYAFIKPTKEGWFYKYDDDKVTKATLREVLEDNFGGAFPLNGARPTKVAPLIRHNSAYMLVYIRQTRLDSVLLPVTKDDTPPHLQKKLDEELALREARRKEKEEQHLYSIIRVITEDTFRIHGGTDLTIFDQHHDQNPAAARSYRVLKKSTIQELAEKVGHDTGADPRRIRFWFMVNRQNKTVRPDQPIMEPNLTIEATYQKMATSKAIDLRLWAEVAEEVDADGAPIWPTHQSLQNGTVPKNDLILLFLKEFDVEAQSLFGIGHIYISKEKKVEDLLPVILKKMGWVEKSPNGERTMVKLYEEIKPAMIEAMKAKQSLRAAELQDGDIVCFQRYIESRGSDSRSSESRSSDSADRESFSHLTHRLARTDSDNSNGLRAQSVNAIQLSSDRFQDPRLFYDFLLHKRTVTLHPHPSKGINRENYETFELVMSSKHSYDQLAARAGEKLGVDPTHLRFWTMNVNTGAVKGAIKRGHTVTVGSMLNAPYSTFTTNNQSLNHLYFEVMEISLAELDTKKFLKVIWLSEGISKEETFDLLVPKNGTIDDLIQALIKKAKLDDEDTAGRIRLYEASNHKFHRQLKRDAQVISLSDYVQIIAERMPEDDINVDESHLINAFHFQGEPNKPHGMPFRFSIIEAEKFSDTKKRLEQRTGIKGKNFEKIKFAVVKRSSYSKPHYLKDDDILWDVATSAEDLLGLDHIDKTRSMRNGAGDLFLK